ncbi:MAG: 2-dehydropantoate 2-reductase, partial [Candidatus Omnitrophica bacterium]|nr:2-dehydropantoate 2-reductase [Candidatus Omnitrophota bacterium]
WTAPACFNPEDTMKIVIVGPGALGSLIAALLTKTKEDIWLLDKDEARAALLERKGLRLEGLASMEAKVNASADPKEIGAADLVILCVKSYDTKKAMTLARPLVPERGAVLTLQNGIGNIEIANEVMGEERVIGGVTIVGATLVDTGVVRYTGKGETVIGKIDGSITVELRTIRELFIRAGLQTRISRDIKGALWSKLVINAGINALTALTRLPNGKLLDYEGTRTVMRQAVTEAVKVAKRKRIKLTYDDPLSKVEAVCEATAGNISSMLQDVLKKRRTEIDAINAVIVRHGQESGIPVPVNTLLVELVKTIESSYGAAVS